MRVFKWHTNMNPEFSRLLDKNVLPFPKFPIRNPGLDYIFTGFNIFKNHITIWIIFWEQLMDHTRLIFAMPLCAKSDNGIF